MIFLYLFIFVTFCGVLWAQIQRAHSTLIKISKLILQDSKSFDSSILNYTSKDRLPSLINLLSENAQLYLIYKEGNDIKIIPLNNSINQHISKAKYRKLQNRLNRKMLICSYVFSPSIYYRLDSPNSDYILWIFNF